MPARKPSTSLILRRLGEAVVRSRTLGALTQEAVAEAAGLSVQFLRRVERGTGNPSYLSMLKIADALKIELEELVRNAR